jgi:septum formation protein
METGQRLILASSSPRRRRLMEQLGLDFGVVPSGVQEVASRLLSPTEVAKENAYRKAKHVAARLGKGLIVGADTLVILGDTVLGKPQSPAEAIKILQTLSGKTHQVCTGLALVDVSHNRWTTDYMSTQVSLKPLSLELIRRYVATGEPLGKAGAYAIQGKGAILIEKIVGCYSNVVGLPLPLLAEMLEEFGISVIK